MTSKLEQLRAERDALIKQKDAEIEQAYAEERKRVLNEVRQQILLFKITYRELRSYCVRPPEPVKSKSLVKKKRRERFDLLGDQVTDLPKRGRKKLAVAA